MPAVSPEYIEQLAPIYQDVFEAIWMFNPNGRPDWGVAAQSLYSVLGDKTDENGEKKYTLGKVREACDQLVRGRAKRLEKEIFYHPTKLGKAIIEAIQLARMPTTTTTPPPFSPPPGFE